MTTAELHREDSERLGLFGGTFNPIHNGHVLAALEIRRRLGMRHLFFIPSAQPPHKDGLGLVSAHDRLEMVRLAIRPHSGLEVSDIEIRRGGRSYTIDTIQHFKASGPRRELYFLVGMDAFLEIDTWKRSKQLFEEAAFVVMSRPPHDMTDALRARLERFIGRNISDDYHFEADRDRFRHPRNPPIILMRVAPVDISSSRIRAMLARGESTDMWIPPAVADFIARKGLYQ